MLYHITYRKGAAVEVGRVTAGTRSAAITAAAYTFNVRRAAILSAVACPRRAE